MVMTVVSIVYSVRWKELAQRISRMKASMTVMLKKAMMECVLLVTLLIIPVKLTTRIAQLLFLHPACRFLSRWVMLRQLTPWLVLLGISLV